MYDGNDPRRVDVCPRVDAPWYVVLVCPRRLGMISILVLPHKLMSGGLGVPKPRNELADSKWKRPYLSRGLSVIRGSSSSTRIIQ